MKNTLATIVSLLMIGFTVLFWYWFLYPYQPLEMNEPVEIEQDVYHTGDVIYATFNFKKNTDIIPDISMSLVDGVVYTLPKYSPINPPGIIKDRVVGILQIPLSIPCGEYHLDWVASYQMNPIRTVDVMYESEKFRVESDYCFE